MEKIVIKIGGSAFTEKSVDYFPLTLQEIRERRKEFIRFDVLKREIREIYEAGVFPLVVINGAGPFGHYLVSNWDLLDEKEIVHESVAYLNRIVVDYFKRFGIKTKSIAPFHTCKYLGNGNFDIIKLYELAKPFLESNEKVIVSTYGDIVKPVEGVSGSLGDYHVISGDDLAILLADLWKADKIIMVIDEDGVYDRNPKKFEDANLIKTIGSSEKLDFLFTSERIDVTGGIAKKVEKLQKAAERGIKGQIINGLKKGYLKRALLGDERIGTLILP